ncbi:hypothetical protein ACFSJY_16640 [Thalassotalea euphylliae]|uniref:hypothetical protein n=1 Tax=Thalassotalea euphylliae TaxID=1655234 RepID=UPI00362AF2CD
MNKAKLERAKYKVENPENFITHSMFIAGGIAIGVTFGSSINNLSMGIALGLAVGAIAGGIVTAIRRLYGKRLYSK